MQAPAAPSQRLQAYTRNAPANQGPMVISARPAPNVNNLVPVCPNNIRAPSVPARSMPQMTIAPQAVQVANTNTANTTVTTSSATVPAPADDEIRMLKERIRDLLGQLKTMNQPGDGRAQTRYQRRDELGCELVAFHTKCQNYRIPTSDAGLYPLHIAAYANVQEHHIARLIELGLDVNTVDANNNTPLHFAVMEKASMAIRLLINKGANQDSINNKGKKPSDYAALVTALRPVKTEPANKPSVLETQTRRPLQARPVSVSAVSRRRSREEAFPTGTNSNGEVPPGAQTQRRTRSRIETAENGNQANGCVLRAISTSIANASPQPTSQRAPRYVVWTVEQVAWWVKQLAPDYDVYAKIMFDARVDGEGLRRLNEDVLINTLHIKQWGVYSKIIAHRNQLNRVV